MSNKPGRKFKKERNKIIVEKRDENPKKNTFKTLGDMFNITRGRACQIYHRDKDKYKKDE